VVEPIEAQNNIELRSQQWADQWRYFVLQWALAPQCNGPQRPFHQNG
jgi:hypothetical protein